jgi:hypothetical protein
MKVFILSFLMSFCGFILPTDTDPDYFVPVVSSETGDVVVNFTGDCVFSNHFEGHIGDEIDSVFRELPWFRRADINLINLEHPITTLPEEEEKEYTFKMDPAYLALLRLENINIVHAANNHIYDYGIQGIDDTMHYLDSVHVAYVGIGKTLQEAREPVIFTMKGMRLGFLGYFGGRGQFTATDTTSGIAPRYQSYILSDIRKLRSEVDYIIVSFHWGVENERYPEDWQRELGKASIDAGADLIVGHHPHILQSIERYNNGVIAYSLGNFIFGGHHRPVHDTIVLQVLFGEYMSVRPIPVCIQNWRALPISGAAAVAVLDTLHFYSHDYQQCFFEEIRLHGEKHQKK